MSEEILPALDREQCFLLFCNFAGDCEKTAHAAGIRPIDVLRAADELGWHERLRAIFALKKSAAPLAIERTINRALNFVLCHRYRMTLERVVSRISAFTDAELDDYIFTSQTKEGATVSKLNTRALTDLSAAIEKMSAASYQALADTSSDRAKRDEEDQGGESGGQIHALIAKSMSELGKDTSPRALLLEAQIQQGNHLAIPEKAVSPNDDDNH